MENYVVSARKYRPATFDTVIGQSPITITLKNSIRQNKLAQAFLFCGPRGVGKTTCARILAKTINCTRLTESLEPCNECESCLNFNTSASFNIFELDAASNNSVEDIRSLIDQVRIPPQTGKYKVYIIDEVHMLSQAAFNAFLKTLEEPPAYAKFILATTEKHKVLPTILSRCQVFDFRRITVEDIVKQLKYVAESQQIETEEDALHIIGQKADGSMRDALSIFDQIVSFSGNQVTYAHVIENLNVLDYDYYFRLTDLIFSGDVAASVTLLNEIIERGFDGQPFIGGFSTHLRNLLMGQDKATIRLIEVGETLKTKYLEQSARCSASFLLKALETSNQFDLNYRVSNHKRLHLEIMVMQLCQINQGLRTLINAKPEVVKKTVEPLISIDPQVPAAPKAPLATKPSLTNQAGNGNTGYGSISIKAVHSNLTNHNKAKEEEADPAEGKEETFDTDRLESAWIRMAETYRKEMPSLYSTLIKRNPLLEKDSMIRFVVDNKYQEELMTSKKQELTNFLKKILLNRNIGLVLEVSESLREDKPYTAVDKYKKMAENNPAIPYFKEHLGLELDL